MCRRFGDTVVKKRNLPAAHSCASLAVRFLSINVEGALSRQDVPESGVGIMLGSVAVTCFALSVAMEPDAALQMEATGDKPCRRVEPIKG